MTASRFLTNKKAVVGISIVSAIVLMALLAPWISPYDPLEVDPLQGNHPPSLAHLLGTDFYGRDILSRIMWGSRPSLMIGLASVTIGCLIGSLIGLVAGYFRGLVDAILMRIMDVILSFPVIILALAIIAGMGPSLLNLVLTITILFVPRFARVVRSEAIALRELDYIDAARVSGRSAPAIIYHHILPNSIPAITVTATVFLANAVLIEAGLSFLGVGVIPPTASWGNMLSEGRTNILGAPWVTTFPGLFLSLTLVGFNLMGDALRDVLDPRLQGLHT